MHIIEKIAVYKYFEVSEKDAIEIIISKHLNPLAAKISNETDLGKTI